MTEPDPVPDRLGRWFAQEVRRAERDLAGRPVAPVLRHRRSSVGPAVASLVAAATIVVGVALAQPLVRQPAKPTVTPDETLAPSASAVPTGPTAIGLGPDIPSAIDGEPVLDISAALARAARASGPDSFLIGGIAVPPDDCLLYRPVWFITCPKGMLVSPERDAYAIRTPIVIDELQLPLGPVILRVHVFDDRERTCDPGSREACRQAIVADSVVWSDPVVTADTMPTEIDGQPVLDPSQALARAQEATAPDTFMIGGTAEQIRRRCVFEDGAHGENLLLGCRLLGIREGEALAAITSDRVIFDPGPIVLRVHAADPRSAECAADTRDACRTAIVAEKILWPRQQIVGAGFPVGIGGQDVLSPAEASELARQPGPMPDTLVAGIIDRSTVIDCFTPAPELGFGCGDVLLTGRRGPVTGFPSLGGGLLALRLDAWIPDLDRVVARVHSHDAAAAGCPAEVRRMCEESLVIDAIVWIDPSEITTGAADRLPESIGSTKVLRPSEFRELDLKPGEQRVVAGWVAECVIIGCQQPILGDTPSPDAGSLELVDGAARLAGPAVVIVERDDAGVCLDEPCRSRVQVAAVLWNGDESTSSAPFGVYDMLAVLSPDQLELAPEYATCHPGAPSLVWRATGIDGQPISSTLMIFPTSAAREAYESTPVTSPCLNGLFTGQRSVMSAHNVMLIVDLPASPSPDELAAKAALQVRQAELAAAAP